MPEYLKIIIVPTPDGQRHTITVPEPVDYARTETYARSIAGFYSDLAISVARNEDEKLRGDMARLSADAERAQSALADRIRDLELTVWRYHKRQEHVERLVAVGYDEGTAAEIVDRLVVGGVDAAERGVTLREQLATLNYTPTEIEECIEDVPNLTQADIDYAKEILDAWDPAKPPIYGAFKNDPRLVVLPKIDTSNVTDASYYFYNCENLGYIPWLDTSKVTNADYMFDTSYYNGYVKLRRLPRLSWEALKRAYRLYAGIPQLKYLPSPLDLSHTFDISNLFDGSSLPDPFPEILFPPKGDVRFRSLGGNISGKFPLTEFPDNVVDLGWLYCNCKVSGDLSGMTFKAHGVKDAGYMFAYNVRITHAPQVDMPEINSLEGFLAGCHGLEYVPDYTACKPYKVHCMLNGTENLRRVEGLNFARVWNAGLFSGSVSCQNDHLTYMRIVNLGQYKELSSCDLSLATVWGTGSEEARQSLVNSLLTDSYDRAAAGMTPTTVRQSTASKAALTAEEIAAITAKGFTIA